MRKRLKWKGRRKNVEKGDKKDKVEGMVGRN